MKLLFTRFPLESRLGGAEIQTISLMEGLIARGHAVAFAGSCPTLLRLCKEHHIPAVEWKIGPPPATKWLAISFLWRAFSMKSSLKKLLAQFADVDAVCMLSLSEKLLLTHIVSTQKKKVLWIEHDRIGRWLRKNPWLGLLKKQSALAMTVAVSNLSKRLMEEIGFDGSRIRAIPNGIDETRFASLPGAVQQRPLALGCVARLTRDKGVHVLIDAMRHVANAELVIVGEGPELGNLWSQIKTGELLERVRIVPSIEDLGAFYRSVDVLVLPSIDNDPFGMTVAEAMFCGTAVIATDQCGISGYLRHNTDALIVRANDASDLASALLRLQDQNTRATIAHHCQEVARTAFSLEHMIDSYEALLRG